tara:strand:- start:146 stop:400 length:255 start_codon:yes stop_codon:yes gene_type:complete
METAKEAEMPNNSSMAALGQYWADLTQNLTQTADTNANSRSQGAHARLEIVVRRAGVAMELRPTTVTVNEADHIVDFIMVVLGY